MENLQPDEPARRPDGSLKDASEMEWEYSPSAKTSLLPDVDVSTANDKSVDDGKKAVNSAVIAKRLKGKEPANVVAGKRVSKPTIKVSASSTQRLSPRTRRFFNNRFEGKYLLFFFMRIN